MMASNLQSGETAIRFIPKFKEYGIPVLDGGESFIVIQFCPWCGKKLPDSRREQYFDELERGERL